MSLMREFLRYLVQGKYDNRSVNNVILYSISSANEKVKSLNYTHYYLYCKCVHICIQSYNYSLDISTFIQSMCTLCVCICLCTSSCLCCCTRQSVFF